jgi:hypothetical protein
MDFALLVVGQLRAIVRRYKFNQRRTHMLLVWIPTIIIILSEFTKLIVLQVCGGGGECFYIQESRHLAVCLHTLPLPHQLHHSAAAAMQHSLSTPQHHHLTCATPRALLFWWPPAELHQQDALPGAVVRQRE